MKKLTSMIALLLTVVNAVANPIDAEKARQIAAGFLPSTPDFTLVAQAPRNQAKSLKLSKEVAATSPYYIYSRGEGHGFVIVAGDDCLPTILGYTEYGDFDASNIPPALQDMLDGWAQAVEDAQVNGTNQTKTLKLAAERENIQPIMTSHWHQTSPYNNRCPYLTGTTNRAVTGCVATAASQILYYWRRDLPSTLQATTPTYGYGDAPVTESVPAGTELRWDLMQDSYSGGESAAVKNAVAEFVFATGAATWLTYGSSTSGNIEKIPYTFSAYFGMNGGTVHYRNSYSQDGWVKLLYGELTLGRPVMYTGVHPTRGGHAVVVHGYRKTGDLFYFNFGWGGGSDGYYTVDTETGMNGFNEGQSALIGAYPKTWNIDTDIEVPEKIYAQRTAKFKFNLTNNSTLPLQGFYLFASTSATTPTSLSPAKSKDTETIIETGKSATITLSCKPTSTSKWYITLTDKDLNVLKKIEVTPEVPSSKLILKSIYAQASADTEIIGGVEYSKFYSNKAVVDATIMNDDDIDYEGTGKINVYVYDEEAQQWTLNGTTSATVSIDAKSSKRITFNMTNTSSCPLAAGKRYYAEVASPWKTSATEDVIQMPEETPKAYFVITGESDLAVTSFENNILNFTGHWDRASFESIAKRNTYATANVYDLTQVQSVDVNHNPDALPNPNALVYVPGWVRTNIKNVVYVFDNEDVFCDILKLTAGYDFQLRADIPAFSAELYLNGEVGKWYQITVPFDAFVPDGVYARQINSHTSRGLNANGTPEVYSLVAGYTYLIMPSTRDDKLDIGELGSTYVVASPAENPDPAVKGVYMNTVVPVGAFLINDDETQYFEPIKAETEIGGLRGYFTTDDITAKFRVNTTTGPDPAYITLAKNIQTASDILDEYGGSQPVEIREAFADSIAEAKNKFTHRVDNGLSNTTEIKKYAANLLAMAEQFKNGEFVPTFIEVVEQKETVKPTVVGIFTASGVQIPQMQSGLNILRMSDNTTKKVFVP